MRKFKSIAALAASIVTAAVTMLSCFGSATANEIDINATVPPFENIKYKDPDNNGYLSPSDSLPIQAYLLGLKTPYDDRLTHFDINDNGIISYFDSWLISAYFAGGFDGPSSSYANYIDLNSANSSTAYWRHNCSSSNSHSYTSYSLSERNWNPYTYTTFPTYIDPSDMMKEDNGETAVVRLSDSDSPEVCCTGTIVGDHVIATAAHCVYSNEKGFFKDLKIDIIEDGITPIETFNASYVHIPQEYTINQEPKFDYALIYVEDDLSDYGKFELGIAMDSFTAASTGSEKVKVSGFPFNEKYMPAGAEKGQRYVAEGIVMESNDTDNFIHHNAHVTNGHSGSPIYIEETFSKNGLSYKGKTLIAIHTTGGLYIDPSGNLVSLFGYGTRITQKHALFYLSNPYITG